MTDTRSFYGLDEPKSKIDYKINNIVATIQVELIKKLDLVKITRKFNDAEYFPERFPGLIFRQQNPRATFLIFSTGKMVITGLEDIQTAEKAVNKLLARLKKVGIKLPFPTIRIENIVANRNLYNMIDLNKAAILLEYAMYEPEIFPGLIYYMNNPQAVFLLFSTGKFVCTGIKNERIIEKATLKLSQIVNRLEILVENNLKKNKKRN